MIVDSSALLAILYRERDAPRYEQLIATTPNCRMSVANALETSIVVEGRGGAELAPNSTPFSKASASSWLP